MTNYIIFLVTYDKKEDVIGYAQIEMASSIAPTNTADDISYIVERANEAFGVGDEEFVDMYGYIDPAGNEFYWEEAGSEVVFR